MRKNLAEIVTVFRRKYVKPQSMATPKYKFQRLMFNLANQKLIDFLDELQKLAKDNFVVAAQQIIEQFIYVKMPPHLKKLINQAHLENGTYEQIVIHLEKELELNSLEALHEFQMNTVMQKLQIEGNKDNTGKLHSDKNNSNPNNNKNDRESKTVCLPCGTCGHTIHSKVKCYYGANAASRPLPRINKPAVQNGPQLQNEQSNITESVMAAAQALT